MTREETVIIPKIFHFIWIGPRELPERHREWIETWEFHNPDWEIRLWGNDNLPRMRNREQFEAAGSWAGKADILRVEVVHQYGGVYVDTDMECLRPIDELLIDCESFVARTEERGVINNNIFGGVPEHEFTRTILDLIPRHFNPRKPYLAGPALFTRIGESLSTVRIFERRVFSPVTFREKTVLPMKPEFPGAYAIHWFEASWVKRPSRFQILAERMKGLLRRA